MRCRAYPGLPAKSCLQEVKALQWAKPNTFQIYWTIHFEERIPKILDTLLFYTEKLLAVEKKQAQEIGLKTASR